MSELKPCPFCRGEGEIENAEKNAMSVLVIMEENRRLNRALILSRTVIDAVARETNKDFTAINAMIDEALKEGE